MEKLEKMKKLENIEKYKNGENLVNLVSGDRWVDWTINKAVIPPPLEEEKDCA